MSSILIDTDILIDAARQDAAALATLTTLEQRKTLLAVSCVTQMELLVGCRNKTELQKTERFLRRFSILPLNQDTCDRAVELLRQYRLSHGLLIPDALIAATALTRGLDFITKNQRDFHFITDLSLQPYPVAPNPSIPRTRA